MNQPQQYLGSEQSHLTAAQSYQSQPPTAGGMAQYSSYQQQQPPLLQPGPGNYAPAPSHYGQYGYPNGVTSPQSAGHPVSSSMGSQMNSGLLPLPTMPAGGPTGHTYVGAPTGPPPGYAPQSADTSGQVAPSGMKPRVTATLWEDEGCMCFQVEAKGICVARRDDNHMINGTKLLNVAGMTRGRRDGILKSEKLRNVVKIGPMHLKGVWIPFERALDFANKEKITESLYPLFVHNIGALLYHPTNQSRTNAVMAAADRQKLNTRQQGGPGGTPGSQPPSLHHHHSMNSAIGSQPPHSIAPHPSSGRPGLERSQTFPTPPTSASSTSIGLNNQGNSYDWGNQNMTGGVQGGQPLVLDSHPHSTPATPATTPPNASVQGLQPYQSHPAYENPRPMYSAAAPQQPQYATQQVYPSKGTPLPSTYKQDMGPPASRGPGSRADSDHGDSKADVYGQGNEQVGHGSNVDAEHDHDPEYSHSSNGGYTSHRDSYAGYSSGPMHNDPISSKMTGSPSHQNGSAHGTPHNANASQQQWTAGYHTPPRAPPSSNLYNPMSDARGSVPNGNANADHYSSVPMHPYAPTQQNGVPSSGKRLRDDEDYSRPASRTEDADSSKRRKMGLEGNAANGMVTGPYENEVKSHNRPRSVATPRTRVRG